MHPIETDFPAPILDFFKPRKFSDVDYIRGVELQDKKVGFYIICYKPIRIETRFFQINSPIINKLCLNNIDGLRLYFNEEIIYFGNYGGGINLKFPLDSSPIQFSYYSVARVGRVNDGLDKIVWENLDVPLKKRVFLKK